ncbi:uncharacterized protein Z518_03505 [Rhinocladiella mackenziei CBS 650.93]|uniref:Rhinocladiella mackenziei CBS 650.93 unplaced genomic scaffold supercont1.2, whole genome shotgun sequence n=1 Tax=Rhinocladiella mackenziei CBS 650.93 TaxID=1442369 RepID=A0A0D2HE54_9EURO|nr:uncharacterized protein Z518_03505 [Rhinocladiella mackenziei CBS 650.93]KIX08848.1 hypothetical protein Z518_03505 [Rhinocladiella mackenziei CBS 650.93]
MPSAQQSEPSNGCNWKAKFTKKQLERKRLVDRVGQKRTRQLLKRSVAQLEEKVHLLVQGEHNTLLRNLIEENAAFRAALDRYETRMETILLCSKECLEMSQTGDKENGPKPTIPNLPLPVGNSISSLPGTSPTDQVCDRLLADGSLPFFTSVMFRDMLAPLKDVSTSPLFPVDYIVEQVNTWKLVNKHGLGFDFLIKNLALDREPMYLTTDIIRQRTFAKSFYADILNMLVPESESSISPPEAGEERVLPALSEMECQRRSVALCACEVVSRWRPLYRSNLECVSIYWAVYKFFMFLTFPCRENLLKVPPWLWPTESQLCQEHPGFIDCLLWPSLREKLIDTWHNYNVKALMIQLVRHFQILDIDHVCVGLPLSVESDFSGLCLDSQFEAIIFDIRKWSLSSAFFTQFPELQSCVQTPPAEPAQCPSTNAEGTDRAPIASNPTANQWLRLGPPLPQSLSGQSTQTRPSTRATGSWGSLPNGLVNDSGNPSHDSSETMDPNGDMCDGDFAFDQFQGFEAPGFSIPFHQIAGDEGHPYPAGIHLMHAEMVT